jgi:hypothetical protein
MAESVTRISPGIARHTCPLKLFACLPSCCFNYNGECVYQMVFTNHKGGWCWIRNDIFCQEGDCLSCQVYVRL